MWILYQVCYVLALGLAAPFLLLSRGRRYGPTLAPRLGRQSSPPGSHAVWLHAVSVGEVGVAATLATSLATLLPPAGRILLTTITPTGQEQARTVASRPSLRDRLDVAYLPFDLDGPVRRFLDAFAPAALVLVEGDLWPLLLRRARDREVPVVVVNGRISDRSYRRLRRLRGLLAPLLRPVAHWGMQTGADRDRLLALGVPSARVTVTGNLKFEMAEPSAAPELEELVRRLAAGRPTLVAGSTAAGEDELVLDAFERLGAGKALLVLAPRHPERFGSVTGLVGARGLRCRRRSDALADASATLQPDVLVLDSLGELGALYRLATTAFVGGTLVPRGGHNPLEPARFGVPVAVGPSMENFREIADSFDRDGAWRRVRDADELAAAWAGWLDDPAAASALGARGRALFLSNRGALDRTLELLRPLLGSAATGPDR